VRDKKTLKRINQLVIDTVREPFTGIVKPEPLRGDLSGYWSRRIDESHRLVYQATDTELLILACRFHYDDRGSAAPQLCPGGGLPGDFVEPKGSNQILSPRQIKSPHAGGLERREGLLGSSLSLALRARFARAKSLLAILSNRRVRTKSSLSAK